MPGGGDRGFGNRLVPPSSPSARSLRPFPSSGRSRVTGPGNFQSNRVDFSTACGCNPGRSGSMKSTMKALLHKSKQNLFHFLTFLCVFLYYFFIFWTAILDSFRSTDATTAPSGSDSSPTKPCWITGSLRVHLLISFSFFFYHMLCLSTATSCQCDAINCMRLRAASHGQTVASHLQR